MTFGRAQLGCLFFFYSLFCLFPLRQVETNTKRQKEPPLTEVEDSTRTTTKKQKDRFNMLRRVFPVSRAAVRGPTLALTAALRHGHHAQTRHDFSGCFLRKLTREEEESLRVLQDNRPVSAVVPGKLFMRHWIAAEQSTVSVVNRVMSGIISVCLMLWSCGYATLGYNGHNCAHVAGWIFIAFWLVLHTHCMAMIPLFSLIALMQLVLN
ncbi:hypothetical protein TCSYLVIO_010627 [Trypanosoma cruzi]|nr:hypothetical protein TCSYLVIO_010627 [Trypanosoma cruzi]